MVRSSFYGRSFLTSSIVLTGLAGTNAAAEVLLSEDFSTNPIGTRATAVQDGDPSRFTHNGDGTLTAAYNTFEPTTKLLWALPDARTLTQDDSFEFEATFKLSNVTADPNGFAQISFGMVNSSTTGLDRTGSFADFFSDDTFDMATIDYFPNVSPSFPSPTIQPVIFESDDGNASTDAFAGIHTPGTKESGINDVASGEADLLRDVFLTARFAYDAVTRRVTLTVTDDNGDLLNINGEGDTGPGGPDGDLTTIQVDLLSDDVFTVDAFSFLLWNDGFAFGSPSVSADVTFDRFSVTLVPEPSMLALVSVSMLAMCRRRRRA